MLICAATISVVALRGCEEVHTCGLSQLPGEYRLIRDQNVYDLLLSADLTGTLKGSDGLPVQLSWKLVSENNLVELDLPTHTADSVMALAGNSRPNGVVVTERAVIALSSTCTDSRAARELGLSPELRFVRR